MQLDNDAIHEEHANGQAICGARLAKVGFTTMFDRLEYVYMLVNFRFGRVQAHKYMAIHTDDNP